MNKFFTSILALACLGVADASALTLTYNGQPVNDGDEINVGYTQVDGVGPNGEPLPPLATWTPLLSVESDQNTDIVVIGTCSNPALVSSFQDCSFGVCKVAPFNNTYPIEANIPAELEIHRGQMPVAAAAAMGDLEGVLTVADANNDAAKVTVTINFVVKPADEEGALDNVAANGEYVRLESGNTLSYNLNGNTHIEVYSILGTRMIDRHVSGHGSLSLSGLGRGVYIYRAGKLSGKVVVK